jgi:hypothetical protein
MVFQPDLVLVLVLLLIHDETLCSRRAQSQCCDQVSSHTLRPETQCSCHHTQWDPAFQLLDTVRPVYSHITLQDMVIQSTLLLDLLFQLYMLTHPNYCLLSLAAPQPPILSCNGVSPSPPIHTQPHQQQSLVVATSILVSQSAVNCHNHHVLHIPVLPQLVVMLLLWWLPCYHNYNCYDCHYT